MRIAIISRTDSSAGGAGKVAEDLVDLVNAADGASADLWCGYAIGKPKPTTYSLYGNWVGELVYRAARYVSRRAGFPDFIPLELLTHFIRKAGDYDLYHFHSISAAVSPLSVRWIGERKPTVWTFHDCSPFTGGCLYPALVNCDAYIRRCESCPQLRAWPMFCPVDFTGRIQDYKRSMAKSHSFVPVVPSRWMAEQALRSGMFETEPKVIPNCVDTGSFKRTEKNSARKQLGIRQGSFVLLLNAAFLSDERKGIRYALEALRRLPVRPEVIALGARSEELARRAGFPVACPGYVKEKKKMALYYSAADVFVFPTLADNLPLAAIECIACGTPVVGFRSGGLPEIIEHDVNGWLGDPRDVEGLCHGLEVARLDAERRWRWGENGIEKVRRNYQPETFLRSHLELYGELSDGWKKR